MKTTSLPSELRAAFDSRVLAHNVACNVEKVAPQSFACYIDGALSIHLFANIDGDPREVITHQSSAPFAVALDAALARFVFNFPA